MPALCGLLNSRDHRSFEQAGREKLRRTRVAALTQDSGRCKSGAMRGYTPGAVRERYCGNWWAVQDLNLRPTD
jgi:hypothetical protein